MMRVAASAAGLLLLAGCADVVDGTGSAQSRPSPSSASTTSTAPTSTPTTPTTTPTSTVPVTPPSTTAAPVAATPPSDCSDDACEVTTTADLGPGSKIVVRHNAGVGHSFLSLVKDGVAVAWVTIQNEYAGTIKCSTGTVPNNCVVTTGVGAHGAAAYALLVGLDGKLALGESVGGGTPIIDIVDLDGDNRLDVAVLQNDYTPDYATGKVQYQTFKRTTDALSFTETGCTPKATKKPPVPTAFATGPCEGG